MSGPISKGMIQKIGVIGSSGSGRKVDILRKVPEYASVISISLTYENNNISLIDLGLNTIFSKKLSLGPDDSQEISIMLVKAIQEI